MRLSIPPAVRRFAVFSFLLLAPPAVLLFLFPERPGAAQTQSSDAVKLPTTVKPSEEELRQAYDRAFQFTKKVKDSVFRTSVKANWLPDNTRFWYRNDLRGGAKEFILVDAARATRTPAFDHQHLAVVLSKATGKTYQADRLPFDRRSE